MARRPIALVTGASRGIGAATARTLAPTHELLLGGRDEEALRSVAQDLPDAHPWPVELTDPVSLSRACVSIDRLDVLVHSAGTADLGAVSALPVDTWRRSFEINVFAVAELTRLLLPALRSSNGDVLFVNSGAGLHTRPQWGVYSASKFALRAYADALRAEEPDIRVCSVFPGRTATDMQRGVREFEGGQFEADRYLRPDSVAATIVSAINATSDAHLTELVMRPTS